MALKRAIWRTEDLPFMPNTCSVQTLHQCKLHGFDDRDSSTGHIRVGSFGFGFEVKPPMADPTRAEGVHMEYGGDDFQSANDFVTGFGGGLDAHMWFENAQGHVCDKLNARDVSFVAGFHHVHEPKPWKPAQTLAELKLLGYVYVPLTDTLEEQKLLARFWKITLLMTDSEVTKCDNPNSVMDGGDATGPDEGHVK
jgi:hypothetical protein